MDKNTQFFHANRYNANHSVVLIQAEDGEWCMFQWGGAGEIIGRSYDLATLEAAYAARPAYAAPARKTASRAPSGLDFSSLKLDLDL